MNLSHVWVVFQFTVGALCNDSSLIHNDNLVSQVHEIDGVSHQDSSLLLENALEDFGKDLLASLGIQCRDWVVHKDHIWPLVDGSGKTDSCFLASREIDSLFTNFSHITCRHKRDISFQLASHNSFNIFPLIRFTSEADIVSQVCILDPVLALNKSSRPSDSDWTASREVLLQERVLKRLQLV